MSCLTINAACSFFTANSRNYIPKTNLQNNLSNLIKFKIHKLAFEQLKLLPADFPDYLKFQSARLLKLTKSWPTDFDLQIESITRKTSLFHLATRHLYSQLMPANPSFALIGHIHDDGIGDYYHLLAAAEQINKDYPNAKIHIVAVFKSSDIPHHLKIFNPSIFETILCNYDNFSQDTLNNLKSADLVVEVSQKVCTSIERLLPRCAFIGEYGHPHETRPMGVSENHLGLFIRDMPKTESLLELKNVMLKQLLFNTTLPTKNDLEIYLKQHEPFTAYLKSGFFLSAGLNLHDCGLAS